MVFVTHRAPELLALADDCVVLEAGRVIAQGSPLEVLKRPRALGVANLVGVDNLLRLPVLRHDTQGGVTWLDLGNGSSLAVPLCDGRPEGRLDVGFHADEVMLCLEAPRGVSARNVLRCRAEEVETLGPDVLVTVRIGGTSVFARVTPAAARELGLTRGLPLVAVVKSAAIHVLSEPAPPAPEIRAEDGAPRA
jgi:molybdate transport system ATP-binding protein